MATIGLTPYISKSYERKDGTFPIRICVYYRGKKKYLTTSLVARKEQLTKNFTIKDYNLRKNVDDLMRCMQDKLNANPISGNMTLDDIIEILNKKSKEEFRLDFPTYGRKIAAEKGKNSSINYRCAINSLCEFMRRDSFDISEITSSLLHSYNHWLVKKHGDSRAVSLYLSSICHIHSRARMEYNNEERGEIYIYNPFSVFKCPKQKPSRHFVTNRKVIQKMIDDRKELTGNEKLGVDLFLISFALMGTNTPDIHSCEIKSGVVRYERTKTRDRRHDRALMLIRIEDCVKPLCEEYIDKGAFTFRNRFETYKALGRTANEGLKSWCERNGFQKVTIKYARHTWATVANSNGIDKNAINSCLCHIDEDMRVTDIYIEKDWSVLWDANKKVLELFDW